MTEHSQQEICAAIATAAITLAHKQGLDRDRTAATLVDAGAMLMATEVGPLGTAQVLRDLADRIMAEDELYDGECLECGTAYQGRSNRKFCSVKCRKRAGKRRERIAELLDEREYLLDMLEFFRREGTRLDIKYTLARLTRVDVMIEKTSPESSPESSPDNPAAAC